MLMLVVLLFLLVGVVDIVDYIDRKWFVSVTYYDVRF